MAMQSSSSFDADVVIAGGGLAGLTLSLQLRQQNPDWRIVVLEKSKRPLPIAAHKVGESSVELGSYYLGKMLGLADYLQENHLFKYGLRFFPGGGHLPPHQRRELGPAREPIVPSYQMDRGLLENDLRAKITEEGVDLLEGADVSEITLGQEGAAHTITFAIEGEGTKTLTTRWFFDATGRNALLRKDLKLTRGSPHKANSSWFRVKGRVDITTFVPDSEVDWHQNEWAEHRWRSTNHLMGRGYWLWIIPLSTGNTSIGLVVHDEIHGFRKIQSLEKLRAFIAEHEPYIFEQIKDAEVLDFRAVRNYSHNIARSFSADRWGMVGEAGAFVDPLYSPGTDFIAFANTFATELVRVDRTGGDLTTRTRDLNIQYRSLVGGAIQLYNNAGAVYDHADAMFMKLYWDNFWYWSFSCQFFIQKIYEQSGENLEKFSAVGQRFLYLSQHLQALVRAWADIAPMEPEAGFGHMPGFPSRVLDTHLALERRMDFDECYAYVQMRADQAIEFVGECLLRVLFTVGEAKARELAETLRIQNWDTPIPLSRVEAENVTGLARRKRITPVALDVQRTLGRHPQNTPVEIVKELLGKLVYDDSQDAKATTPPPSIPVAKTTPSKAQKVEKAQVPPTRSNQNAARDELLQMLGGKWVTAALSAAAQLGIAEHLADGPRPLDDLANRCEAQPDALQRFLRALASLHVIHESIDGHFELTTLGQELRKERLGELAVYVGSDFAWNPWSKLSDAVRTGVPAFDIEHGAGLFRYLSKTEEEAAVYDAGVDAFTRQEAAALVEHIDLREFQRVLDIGGGRGSLLLELLRAAPNLRGTLFDVPEVIERAKTRAELKPFLQRLRFEGGDFHQPIAARADLVVLKHVLHNWGDETALRILRNAAETLDSPNGRIVIIEALLLPSNYPDPARLMDLEMLVLCDQGRERSKSEFRGLLKRAGLRMEASGDLAGTARWMLVSKRDAQA